MKYLIFSILILSATANFAIVQQGINQINIDTDVSVDKSMCPKYINNIEGTDEFSIICNDEWIKSANNTVFIEFSVNKGLIYCVLNSTSSQKIIYNKNIKLDCLFGCDSVKCASGKFAAIIIGCIMGSLIIFHIVFYTTCHCCDKSQKKNTEMETTSHGILEEGIEMKTNDKLEGESNT